MTLEEYSPLALETAIYPNRGANKIYPLLGLIGEVGEVSEKVKKVLRDQDGMFTAANIEAISKELGDVFWYWNALCREFGLDPGYILQENINKLQSRKERGVQSGSGDNR